MLKIRKNVKLSEYSTFRIGGKAKFFVEVSDEKELREVLGYAKENGLKFFILGEGSNALFSDDGFDGIVIKIKNQKSKVKITSQKSKVMLDAPAGCLLSDIINLMAEKGLSGLENLAGIPGTIGGAVWGNAGAYGMTIGDMVEEIRVIEIEKSGEYEKENQKSKIKSQKNNLKVKTFLKGQCGFGYRTSIFKENQGLIIVSISLAFKKGDKKEIKNKVQEILKSRSAKQPKGWKGTAGSFFKNPQIRDKKLIRIFEREKGMRAKDGKLPAGWLIAEAGFLGKSVGGAKVSEEHGNFILNTGKAKAEDVVILASLIKQKVRQEFGVELMEEVQYVGF